MGEQETEFIAMPLRRSLSGSIDRGGSGFAIVVVLADASSRDDGADDSDWEDKDITAWRGVVFEDRFLGMETLVFEGEEAFVASFEMVDALVAIASITRFRSFTTASVQRRGAYLAVVSRRDVLS